MTEAQIRQKLKLSKEAMAELIAKHAVENDVLAKQKQAGQIKEVEKELYSLEEQLKAIDLDRVRRALFSLDFTDQFERFRQIVEDDGNYAAAFLIYGENDDYGQPFLVKRLLERVSRSGEAPVIRSVFFNSPLGTTDLTQLWRQIGYDDGLKDAKKICDKLTKVLLDGRDVVLVYDGCECLPPELVEELLKGLWAPLVQSLQTHVQSEEQGRLFLFLLANGVLVDRLGFADTLVDPRRPVRLPQIARFPDSLVGTWLSLFAQQLPPSFLKKVDKKTAQAIWSQHQGVPYPVLLDLCRSWNADTDWDGVLRGWQNLGD